MDNPVRQKQTSIAGHVPISLGRQQPFLPPNCKYVLLVHLWRQTTDMISISMIPIETLFYSMPETDSRSSFEPASSTRRDCWAAIVRSSPSPDEPSTSDATRLTEQGSVSLALSFVSVKELSDARDSKSDVKWNLSHFPLPNATSRPPLCEEMTLRALVKAPPFVADTIRDR